ncbi:MAG: AMP-binding protein [Sneathiella sp.]|nr:AMP-binding protein [Sneathiella sp.]
MKTLPQLLQHLMDTAADQPAIIDRGTPLNYGELATRSRKIANNLKARGIEKGDRIGVWLPNIAAYLEFFFACAEIGAIVVSVNTKFKSFEMADIVSRSGCKMLVLWPGFKNIPFLDILSEVPVDGLKALQSVILYSEDGDSPADLPACLSDKGVVPFTELYKFENDHECEIQEDDGLVIFTTSGTTGKPKFVLHSQSSITVHAIEVAANFGYAGKSSRMLQAIPLCGTFGLTQALAGLAAKAHVYCMPVFDPADAARIITEHQITDMNGSDDMFAMLLDQSSESIPFPTLKQGGYAAFNPALGDIVEQAEARGIRLMGLWGMSELQALFSHQDPKAPAKTRKLAGGYLASPSAKVRIVDPDTGTRLDHGQHGEIEIKAPSQMKEYFGNPQATKETFTSDGFIKTGDLGYQNEAGQFIFVARMGDVLRLGGYLTDPVEIENCLQEYDGIEQAQVVGVPTSKGVKAFAFVKSEAMAEIHGKQVLEFCKSRLAGYKVPVHIEQVTSFPMTESANGLKIQRSKLREEASSRWQQLTG